MARKIYKVVEHNDFTRSSYVIGVFSTLKDAKALLKRKRDELSRTYGNIWHTLE